MHKINASAANPEQMPMGRHRLSLSATFRISAIDPAHATSVAPTPTIERLIIGRVRIITLRSPAHQTAQRGAGGCSHRGRRCLRSNLYGGELPNSDPPSGGPETQCHSQQGQWRRLDYSFQLIEATLGAVGNGMTVSLPEQ